MAIKTIVEFSEDRCKGCELCVSVCPKKILFINEDKVNSKGYHPPRAVKPEACTGCGLCGIYCPDFAIFGIIVKEVA